MWVAAGVVEQWKLTRRAREAMENLHIGAWRQTGAVEIPFSEHPLAVSELLADQGADKEQIAAGLLHDVLEYTRVTTERLRRSFGERVTATVEAVTEDATIEDYEERKDEQRQRVAAAGRDAQLVFAAEKVANVIAARNAYEVEGEDIGIGLPVDLSVKIMFWEFDMEMLFCCKEDSPLYNRLSQELIALWRQRIANGVELI